MTSASKVSLDEISDIVLGLINEGIIVKINITGTSMVPMLVPNRDSVKLQKADSGNVKKNDVVLYIRDNGAYVLHRLWRIKADRYIMIGDNQRLLESDLRADNLLAKVVEFTRDGKVYATNSISYRIYIALWRLVRPFRTVINRILFRKYLDENQ